MLNPALIGEMNIEDYKNEEPKFETHFRDFLQKKENGKFLQDKDTSKIFSVTLFNEVNKNPCDNLILWDRH